MREIETNISCPSCQGPMTPSVLKCTCCELKVEGEFKQNEFSVLPKEDLEFLRQFISAEGRIRELEKELGVSYPTIKSKIAKLKKTIDDRKHSRLSPKSSSIQSQRRQGASL